MRPWKVFGPPLVDDPAAGRLPAHFDVDGRVPRLLHIWRTPVCLLVDANDPDEIRYATFVEAPRAPLVRLSCFLKTEPGWSRRQVGSPSPAATSSGVTPTTCRAFHQWPNGFTREATLRGRQDGDRSPEEGRCRADAGPIERLYVTEAERVWRTAFGIVGDPTLADDVSQEVWLRVLKYRHRFRGECRISTWIHRIAVNCALRAIDDRHCRTERRLTTGTRATRFDERLCERLVVDEQAAKLPAQMRRILILHAILGYKHEEIAERLGISAGASRSQLWHARRKLADTSEVAA